MPTRSPTASSEALATRTHGPAGQELARLGAAYAKLGRSRLAVGQDPGRAFEEAVLRGLPVGTSLRAIGAPTSIVRLLEIANPPDAAGVLDALLTEFSRADVRARSLGAVGSYALVTASIATLLCVHLLVIVQPLLLQFPGEASPSAVTTQGAWGLAGACFFALASLFCLVTMLKIRAAPWPFVDARRKHVRALWLAGAAVLSRQGVPVHTALRASAALAHGGAEARTLERLASALEQGHTSFGSDIAPTDQALFEMIGRASAAGAGTESLEALASWSGSTIEARWPHVLIRAELTSLLLAGVVVAASGFIFFDQYLKAALR